MGNPGIPWLEGYFFALSRSELMDQDSFYSPLLSPSSISPMNHSPILLGLVCSIFQETQAWAAFCWSPKLPWVGASPFPLSYPWHLFQFCLITTAPGSPPTSQAPLFHSYLILSSQAQASPQLAPLR